MAFLQYSLLIGGEESRVSLRLGLNAELILLPDRFNQRNLSIDIVEYTE